MKSGIEWQVSNLELSQRLRELGVEQESLFYWSENEHGNPGWDVYFHEHSLGMEEWFTLDKKVHISAFTIAELGEMLPVQIDANNDTFWLYSWKGQLGFMIGYGDVIHELTHTASFNLYHVEDADTEADARAKCLIYLLENNLLPTSTE